MNAEGNVLTMKLGLSSIILCTHLIFFSYILEKENNNNKKGSNAYSNFYQILWFRRQRNGALSSVCSVL